MENNSDEMKKTHQELKHLGFVRATAVNTIMWLSSLYDYAKQNSGPLRSAAGAVEGAVTTVVSPVYDKFKGVPDHLLVFLDEKVNIASAKFDEHAPPSAKKVASHIREAIEKTTNIAKGVVHKAQVDGPLAAACYAAKESSELVLDQSIKVWSKLDQLPPFHLVTEMTAPTAAHWSDKYNKLVTDMRGKGYTVFGYIPLIPSEDIAKAFKQYKDANRGEIVNSPTTEVSSQ